MVREEYNTIAKSYFENRKKKQKSSYFYNENLEMPATLKLLGNCKGKKVLDLGCGPGFYSKILSDGGAKVKGLDLSEEELKIAQREVPGVEFIVGSAEKLPYKNNEFDVVLAALVLDHIKSWDEVLSEVRRVLKKGGVFVFSIYNPVSICEVKQKWCGRKFRVVKNYFEEKMFKRSWKEIGYMVWMTNYHKTYETVIKTLVKNKFEIVDYVDCKPLAKSKVKYPKDYENSMNSPHFCSWKVKK